MTHKPILDNQPHFIYNLISIFCLFAFYCYPHTTAADAMPTKEESVNYLQKKVRECDASSLKINDKEFHIKSSSIKIDENKLTLKITLSNHAKNNHQADYQEEVFSQTLPLAQIKSIKERDKNEGLTGLALVHAEPNSVSYEVQIFRYTRIDRSGTPAGFQLIGDPIEKRTDSMAIPFSLADKKNIDRIIRTIEYLRDVAKAEGELFD